MTSERITDLGRPLVRIAFDADGGQLDPEEVDLREREDLLPAGPVAVPA